MINSKQFSDKISCCKLNCKILSINKTLIFLAIWLNAGRDHIKLKLHYYPSPLGIKCYFILYLDCQQASSGEMTGLLVKQKSRQRSVQITFYFKSFRAEGLLLSFFVDELNLNTVGEIRWLEGAEHILLGGEMGSKQLNKPVSVDLLNTSNLMCGQ